jgi:ribonuclease E
LALAVLRKIQEKVTQDDFKIIKGTLPKTVAEYFLNYKRDDLNDIERKHGLQVVIVGQEDMPAGEFHLDFIRADKTSGNRAEGEAVEEKEKPWYKRLLPT